MNSGTSEVELVTVGETMALVSPAHSGALTEGGNLSLHVGGAESNVAVGAAALGIRAAWMSRVGADPLGDLVLTAVGRRGVDVSRVSRDAARCTGLMFKTPSPNGSRVFYYRAASAASALSPDDLANFPPARVVHTSGITCALSPTAHALVERILTGAVQPAITSFDINYRPVLWESKQVAAAALLALARRAHVVFVGRDEAEVLWGTSTAEDVRALLPTVTHLVVKDADIEAVEFHEAGTSRADANAIEVIEPVGAGDAFAAGWLAGWLRDLDASTRLRAGHDSAAAVLQSPHDTAADAKEEPVDER